MKKEDNVKSLRRMGYIFWILSFVALGIGLATSNKIIMSFFFLFFLIGYISFPKENEKER